MGARKGMENKNPTLSFHPSKTLYMEGNTNVIDKPGKPPNSNNFRSQARGD